MDRARSCTPFAVAEQLAQNDNLQELFTRTQEEIDLTVHSDCKLYLGNSGAETELLGDLRALDPEEVVSIIKKQPGNGDYGAFYDFANVPNAKKMVEALKSLPQNYIYGDFASVLYRGLAERKVPTRIL